jgi:cytosine/uracil/thiamine/allantoin permease
MPQTVGVMILSRFLILALILANGWMGADWHIGFSVAQR